MSRVSFIAVASGLLLVLSGCSAGPEESAGPTTSVVPTPASSPTGTPTKSAASTQTVEQVPATEDSTTLEGAGGSELMDDVYLETARERFPKEEAEFLLEWRASTCEAFDAESSQEQYLKLLKAMLDIGLDANDIGYLITAQVLTGCPEHQDALIGSQ